MFLNATSQFLIFISLSLSISMFGSVELRINSSTIRANECFFDLKKVLKVQIKREFSHYKDHDGSLTPFIQNYEDTMSDLLSSMPHVNDFVRTYKKKYRKNPTYRDVFAYILEADSRMNNSFKELYQNADKRMHNRLDQLFLESMILTEDLEHIKYMANSLTSKNDRLKFQNSPVYKKEDVYSRLPRAYGRLFEFDYMMKSEKIYLASVYLGSDWKQQCPFFKDHFKLQNYFHTKISSALNEVKNMDYPQLRKLSRKYPHLIPKQLFKNKKKGTKYVYDYIKKKIIDKEIDFIIFEGSKFRMLEFKAMKDVASWEKITHEYTNVSSLSVGISILNQLMFVKETIQFLDISKKFTHGVHFQNGIERNAADKLEKLGIPVFGPIID